MLCPLWNLHVSSHTPKEEPRMIIYLKTVYMVENIIFIPLFIGSRKNTWFYLPATTDALFGCVVTKVGEVSVR